MARIDNYKYDTIITGRDVLLGSSYITTGPNGPEYETSRYTISSLVDYFSTFLYQGGEAFDIPALEGRIATNESNISLLSSGLSTTNNNVSSLSSRVSSNEDDIADISETIYRLSDVISEISVTDGYAEYTKTVIMPDGVTEIERDFMPSEKVKVLTLNSGLITIGDRAFYDNKLASLSIPNTVESIGFEAFNFNKITSISIPESVHTIDSQAFMYNDMTSISINGSTSIGSSCFLNSSYSSQERNVLSDLYIGDGSEILSGNNFATRYNLNAQTNYTRFTTSYIIENPPVSTNGQIYILAVDRSYDNLTSGVADIPNIDIPNQTFVGCNFSSIVIRDDNNDSISIGLGAMALTSQLNSFTFKSNIISIGDYAFMGSGLQSLDLSSLTSASFGIYCFSNMYRLSSVTLPSGYVPSVGMFYNTPKISSIDLGQITSIPAYMFNNKWSPFKDASAEWRNVFTVQIPSTVTSIGNLAFDNAGIEHITIPASVTSINLAAFNRQKGGVVDLSSSPACFGLNNDLDNTFMYKTYLPPGTETVKRGLKTLTFEPGSNLTLISTSAFLHNELVTVNLPESVSTVGSGAFQGNKISSFTWNNTSSVNIGEYVFAYNEITDISGFLPNGNWSALIGNSYIENAIPSHFFKGNLLSGSITIPSNVTRIYNGAFAENNITTANVPTGCVVDSGAFDSGVTIVYY